jgi:uncharacterized protein with HEPN domain
MSARRDFLDYLADIHETMAKIPNFVAGMTHQQFIGDEKTVFAVIRAIEIIREATKKIPVPVQQRHAGIPWKRMAGMRDRVIHGYRGVDLAIVWQTATKTIPDLIPRMARVLAEESTRKGSGREGP